MIGFRLEFREVSMSYTFEELSTKTVEELREIAKGIEHEAVQGHTQMNKAHLLPAICKALGIEARAHHEAVGIDKRALKANIRKMKKRRDEALAAHDRDQLNFVRQKIHRLKRRIRSHTV